MRKIGRRRIPVYFDQGELNGIVMLLWRHQALVDIVGPSSEASTEAICFANKFRSQCCTRSGAEDPLPDLPMFPTFNVDAHNRKKERGA